MTDVKEYIDASVLPKLLELTHAHCAAPLAEVHKVYMALVAIKDEMGDEDNVEKCWEKCRAHSFKVGDAGLELVQLTVRLLPGAFFGGVVRLLLAMDAATTIILPK